MWKLTIEDDEQKQTSLQLAHDEYGLGRDETNAIRLTDRNISRKHALLKRTADGWLVRDLESYNGTYVNGQRVAPELAVSHGDVLQAGDYRIEFVDESKLVVETGDAAVQSGPVHHRPDRLVVVVGPQPGQEFFLDREHLTVGRSEEAAISINHSSVSRHHADLFSVGNGRFEIVDKDSANGVRINGQEVRRGFIEAGDALELGDVRLRFVGAGKIFRAGFDRSQALPAIQGYDEAMRGARSTSSSTVLKVVGAIAILGVIGVGVTLAYVSSNGPNATASTSASTGAVDPGVALLVEAQALASKGDLAAAHQRLSEIPPSSPTLRDPEVAVIAGKWADDRMKRADGETDPQKRVELLWGVATSPIVDETRRRKAGDKLKEVGVEAPDPVSVKPGMQFMPMPTNFVARPAPTVSAKPSASAAPGSAPVDRKTLDDPKSQMKALEGRMASLSERELKLLIGLCVQENNTSCAARAGARLKELKK